MSGDRRLTVREAAHALNMSVATLYRRVADGSLKLEKDVGRRFVSGAEVERYREKNLADLFGRVLLGDAKVLLRALRVGRGAWKK